MVSASQRDDSDAFRLLAKPVQEAIEELGFESPTLPQTKAFPPILRGENVLLIAPTGSGKTEAVLLPIFSKLLQRQEKDGIAAIYITPLRALNRDMLKRLQFWSTRLGISVEVRHGDTEMKLRRRQARSPPQVLVTTPETLQAILPGSRMRQHLANVRFVVVDEVHELAESKRGAQLTIGLERLQDVIGEDFQRIGLSATVGNPKEVAQFIAGTGRPVTIVQASLSKSYRYRVENPIPTDADFDLAPRLNTSPESAARIRRIGELIDLHQSTLIFVNSREVAEILGHKFTILGRTDVAVHHGSLSKEERAQIEDEFKAKSLKAIICTSTLELGIDIGSVDLVIQYLSPRQVNSLIQRVGRSGHSLTRISEGIIITAYPDDTLESIAAVSNAYQNELEPVLIHEGALDVLAHQVVGIVMDLGTAKITDVISLTKKAYPYRKLSKKQLLDVLHFLESLGEIELDSEEKKVRKARRTRQYYYSNLSMIPDEKRYPMINVITDRKIGTVGDEFMALRARPGLNFVVRGRVWRIVQIEQETGRVYVIPSEDPYAAAPGWDGEIIPVPYDLAREMGEIREVVARALKESENIDVAKKRLAELLSTDENALAEVVGEISEHLKQGAPLPTHDRIVIEAFDKYLIIHVCFGEMVNRTFGSVFDAVLSDRETIIGWWHDGYRILIETPRKVTETELKQTSEVLFGLTDDEVDKAFGSYLKARFPFSYRMKFVADRFGALPRGKTMSYESLASLPSRFEDTPIYDETIREAMLEKVDIARVKLILHDIKTGNIKVKTILRPDKPTPLSFHMLERYSDLSDLMAPEEIVVSNIERMKKAIEARTTKLLCMKCGNWIAEMKIRNLSDEPACEKCSSKLLAPLYLSQDANRVRELLKRRREKSDLQTDELKELSIARRTADLVLSYGKKAIVALEVKGVGPETASRILGKMHSKEDEFYMDLLRAKIQYLRSSPYWNRDTDGKSKRTWQ